jgi:hypothetical protein
MASGKRSAEVAINVLVTVDERHRGELESVARQLEAAGMSVADMFSLGGVIAGTVTAADLEKLQSVEGILSVEEEPEFKPS